MSLKLSSRRERRCPPGCDSVVMVGFVRVRMAHMSSHFANLQARRHGSWKEQEMGARKGLDALRSRGYNPRASLLGRLSLGVVFVLNPEPEGCTISRLDAWLTKKPAKTGRVPQIFQAWVRQENWLHRKHVGPDKLRLDMDAPDSTQVRGGWWTGV